MCVFCQIINGEIEANIVYKDEIVICIIPKDMEVYGHTVVIPVRHFENIFDIREEGFVEFSKSLHKISLMIKEKLGADGINILHSSGVDAQQSVQHLHFHILPRFKDDGVDAWPKLDSKNFNIKSIFDTLTG